MHSPQIPTPTDTAPSLCENLGFGCDVKTLENLTAIGGRARCVLPHQAERGWYLQDPPPPKRGQNDEFSVRATVPRNSSSQQCPAQRPPGSHGRPVPTRLHTRAWRSRCQGAGGGGDGKHKSADLAQSETTKVETMGKLDHATAKVHLILCGL